MSTNGSAPTTAPTAPIIALPAAPATRFGDEMIRALRAPFEPELVKWKVQTNPREDSDMAVIVAYIDARDVAERLDRATGGDWTDDYGKPVVAAGSQISLECRLTVCGVTRKDVGTVVLPREGEDDTKNLYSDAFKRAAVKFGVAAHIYRFPNVQARVEKRGRTCFLTRDSERELYQLAQLVVNGTPRKDWPCFANLKVWGSMFGADGRLELFDEQPEHKPATGEASFTPQPEAAKAEERPAPEAPPRRAERRAPAPRTERRAPAPATAPAAPAPAPAPAAEEPAAIANSAAAPEAAPAQPAQPAPASAIVAKVQAAKAALAGAEAKAGVKPVGEPTPITSSLAAPAASAPAEPTVIKGGHVMASGSLAEQIVREVAAIKAAYGKESSAGIDEVGTSTGLMELATMRKQDFLSQKVTKKEAEEVLERLRALQGRLDGNQEPTEPAAVAGGYDLSAL